LYVKLFHYIVSYRIVIVQFNRTHAFLITPRETQPSEDLHGRMQYITR